MPTLQQEKAAAVAIRDDLMSAPTPSNRDWLDLFQEDDGEVCADGYPEHDWKVMDARDGIRTLSCRRCDAEAWEEIDA